MGQEGWRMESRERTWPIGDGTSVDAPHSQL